MSVVQKESEPILGPEDAKIKMEVVEGGGDEGGIIKMEEPKPGTSGAGGAIAGVKLERPKTPPPEKKKEADDKRMMGPPPAQTKKPVGVVGGTARAPAAATIAAAGGGGAGARRFNPMLPPHLLAALGGGGGGRRAGRNAEEPPLRNVYGMPIDSEEEYGLVTFLISRLMPQQEALEAAKRLDYSFQALLEELGNQSKPPKRPVHLPRRPKIVSHRRENQEEEEKKRRLEEIRAQVMGCHADTGAGTSDTSNKNN